MGNNIKLTNVTLQSVSISNKQQQEMNLENTNEIKVYEIIESNYDGLKNKPQINNVELAGNKTLDELGIQPKGEYALYSDIPSVEGLASEEYVDEAMSSIEIPEVDLSNYTTKEYVDEAIETIELTPGPKGDPGEPGPTGSPGKDGYTPVKGVDYYTEADKEEIVSLVLEAIPSSNEVSY